MNANTERRYQRIESDEAQEITQLLETLGGKSATLLEFVEYVRDFAQPITASIALENLRLKAREILEANQ